MAHDRRDDDVFQVAHGVEALSRSLKDMPMPKPMVDAEFARLIRVSNALAAENETLKGAAYDIVGIGTSYRDGGSDASRAAGFLDDVVSGLRMSYVKPIVYEGVDVSDRDEQIRTTYHMPGEKVSAVVREGSLSEGSEFAADESPLTIARTIVVGEDIGIDQDRSVTAHSVEYEFEGREGRHDARLFQAENGQDHAYAVVSVREGRMFLTPISESSSEQDREITAAGPAREIVGGAGRSVFQYVHPEGFEGLKAELANDPSAMRAGEGAIVGEFSFDTASKGDATGPVRIAGIPWSGSASEREFHVADVQVGAFLVEEARATLYANMRAAGGLMSQAGSIGSPEAPTEAKGVRQQNPSELVAGQAKGGHDR